MEDVKEYCDNTYKRLIGLKAGLYDVISQAEKVSDSVHSNEAKNLMSLVDSIEKGIDELRNQCPPDWSPNKQEMDSQMEKLSKSLGEIADRLNITVPDSTAWI